MITTNQHTYSDGDIELKGFSAHPSEPHGKMPAILVAHDWTGRNAFAEEKAKKLAELGFFAFALDMYGDGKLGNTKEEKSALIQPLMQDRTLLLKRIIAAFNYVKTLPQIDTQKIGAIGFCFGGLCVLDLARSGADVKAVVSFHGLLGAPTQTTNTPIKAHILALHGYDDPMVTPTDVLHFANEMTKREAKWEIDMYGHTMHAFTNPEANDPAFGTVYSETAASTSWDRMAAFFKRVL